MKVLLKAIVLILVFFTIINNSKAAHCCESVEVSYIVTSDCCLEFTVYNPNCNQLAINFKQVENGYYVQEHSVFMENSGETVIYKMCSKPGQTFIDWKIELIHASPCERTGYVDLSNCCECPQDVNSWLTLEVEDDSPECGPEQCKITPHLNIPENITCYKFYSIETSSTFTSGTLPLSTPVESNYFCVNQGQQITYWLSLLKSATEDPYELGCYAEATSEPCVEQPAEPCVPDCEETPFTAANTMTLHLGLLACPGCEVDVTFTWRIACEGMNYQDLQILAIDYPNGSACDNCDKKLLYIEALKGIIAINPPRMNFEPKEPPDCSEIWRVANASCWGKQILYYEVENGTYNEVVRWHPCDGSDCCLQKMQVCRTAINTVTVQQLGSVYTSNSCTMTTTGDDGVTRNCDTACNWAGEINGEFGYPLFGKIPVFEEIKKVESDFNFAISTFIDEKYIEFTITSNETNTVTLEIYNLLGNLLLTNSSQISKGNNVFHSDIYNLINGTYLYNLKMDGKKIASDKFIIMK